MAKTKEDNLLKAIFGGEWENGVEVKKVAGYTAPIIKYIPAPDLEKLEADYLAYTGEVLEKGNVRFPNFSGFYRKRGWTPEKFYEAMKAL